MDRIADAQEILDKSRSDVQAASALALIDIAESLRKLSDQQSAMLKRLDGGTHR